MQQQVSFAYRFGTTYNRATLNLQHSTAQITFLLSSSKIYCSMLFAQNQTISAEVSHKYRLDTDIYDGLLEYSCHSIGCGTRRTSCIAPLPLDRIGLQLYAVNREFAAQDEGAHTHNSG